MCDAIRAAGRVADAQPEVAERILAGLMSLISAYHAEQEEPNAVIAQCVVVVRQLLQQGACAPGDPGEEGGGGGVPRGTTVRRLTRLLLEPDEASVCVRPLFCFYFFRRVSRASHPVARRSPSLGVRRCGAVTRRRGRGTPRADTCEIAASSVVLLARWCLWTVCATDAARARRARGARVGHLDAVRVGARGGGVPAAAARRAAAARGGLPRRGSYSRAAYGSGLVNNSKNGVSHEDLVSYRADSLRTIS